MTAAAAGAAAGVKAVRAQAASAAGYGAPVVELYVPAGALTIEQKGALVEGFTNVVLGALKRPRDPAKRLFMTIIETAEGGFGVNGKVFVAPRK
jgi:phenylpyruvate tautomerase PptA (4-oxalocrotonate tautomerase family)